MELLPLVCFCLLICSGTTFGIKMRVKEDEDVILPCSLDSTNIRTDTFAWEKDYQKNVFQYNAGSHPNNGRGGQDPQFKGRVFHFEDQLQSGNASIEIRKSKMTDSGNYSCIFPYHQPTIRSIIELIVDCILKDRTEEKIAGSCPKPSVTNLGQTKDWALLECEVESGSPKPKVQWLDSENKTVPAGKPQETKGNIILKTTVTKSGVYRCVSTQEDICHQIEKRTNVTLSDKDPVSGWSTGWIIAGLVVGIAIGVGLTLFVWWCKKQYSNRDGTVYHLINRCLQCLRRQNARAEHEAERLNLKRPEQPDQKEEIEMGCSKKKKLAQP